MKYYGLVLWLIVALLAIGGCKKDLEVKTAADPTVYTQGQVTIRGTYHADLDAGRETGPAVSDFQWEQATAIERYIRPINTATFNVTNSKNLIDITYSTLVGLPYTKDKINASNNRANRIPTGTIVAYKTGEGRYGAFQVVSYGYDLSLRWITYNNK